MIVLQSSLGYLDGGGRSQRTRFYYIAVETLTIIVNHLTK